MYYDAIIMLVYTGINLFYKLSLNVAKKEKDFMKKGFSIDANLIEQLLKCKMKIEFSACVFCDAF